MSTKIYTGFKFKGSLMDAHKAFMELREELKPVVHSGFAKIYADHLVNKYDRYAAGLDEEEPNSVLTSFWSEINDRLKESRAYQTRDPEVDFSFEISLLPVSTKKILGIYYTEKNELAELLKSKPYFEDYHYQNSTDRPEEISTRHWNQRKKDWDKALPGSIPAMGGFTAQLVDDHVPIIRRADLVGIMPSMEKRARRMAIEVSRSEWFKEHLNEEAAKKEVSLAMQCLHDHRDYMRTNEGKAEIEKIATMLMLKIKSNVELLQI